MRFKKTISLLTALVLLLLMFNCTVVSAAPTLDTSIPDGSETEYRGYYNDLKTNPLFSQFEQGIVFFSRVNGNSIRVCISDLSLDAVEIPAEYPYNLGGVGYLGNTAYFTCSVSQLSTYHFTYEPYSDNTEQIIYSNDFLKFGTSRVYLDNGVYRIGFPETNWYCRIKFDNSFNANTGIYMTGLDLAINEEAFYEWLVDNNKVSLLPQYIGLAKLKSFIHFYSQYGGSNSGFAKYIGQWFSYMNIVSQTTDNINILKHTIDKLYQEYLDSYMYSFYADSSGHIHHRRDIVTNTSDDDTTLITDTPEDTVDVSILRDILRAVIQFQTSFSDYMERLFAKIDGLRFVTTVVNDGGAESLVDLTELYIYDADAFNDDLTNFQSDIEEVQAVPMGYISTINDNALMPEHMLSDRDSLTVNIPTITGFTVGGSGHSYSTQTGTYTLSSSDYPWLDAVVQRIKRFSAVLLILGYLVHLRYRIPELIRGE